MVAALGGLATAAAGQTLVGTGSGFLVNESGWVLTNAHVVEGCDVVREANLGNAVSVISDTGADLALVLFRGEQDSEPLPLRDRPVRLTEAVVALGFPLSDILGSEIRATTGTVSSLSGVQGDPRFFQISAPIQSGNSGGPVLDANGDVIGIATSKLVGQADEDFQNINFAITASEAIRFITANGLDYVRATDDPPVENADQIESATRSTFLLQCRAYELEPSAPIEPRAYMAPEAVSQLPGMVSYSGMDVLGLDYLTIRDVSLSICQTACEADRLCRAYTFNTRYDVCFLKSDAMVLVQNDNAVGGFDADLTDDLVDSDLSELIQLSGQCLMVGFVGSHSGDAGTTALLDQLAMGQVGNVLLLGRNVETRAQTAELAGLLQAVAGRPILIGIDNEGGAVTRTTGKAGFSEWMTAAAVPEQLGTAETAREYYRIRAGELRQAGVNLNFAPVVDVNVNPASPAIGALGRSFSSDPAVVTTFARACIAGHHDAGLLTCIKHFPGHGSARGDTHEGFVDVTHTWTEAELLPYFELASTGKIDALMLSHVIHAAFTGSGQMPVSLSARAIEFVRSTLRYSGPIVSDDLQMGAIAREMSDDDAAVAALEAGSDLLILANYESPDQDLGLRVNAALVRSVVDGRLRVERLADAARRVASLKLRVE